MADYEENLSPGLLSQRNFSAYNTLVIANAAITFKQSGQIIYIISIDTFYYWNGSSWQGLVVGGGGSEDLAQTLAIGNITDGTSIIISNGDYITGSGGQIRLDFGNDTAFTVTTDAGGFLTPYYFVNSTALSLAGLGGGRIDLDLGVLSIAHNTLIEFNTAPVRFNSLTVTTVPYLNASKILTSSSVTPTELGYISGVTSAIQTQINSKAALSSPTLTGTPVAPTASISTNTTQIATTAFVTTAISNAIAGVNPAVAVKAATTQASDTSGLTYNNGLSGVGAFFTGTINTPLVFDGVTLTTLLQRVLIKNDTQSPSRAFNGIYYLSQVQTGLLPPILTRALDFNIPTDINNTGAIPVVSGTVNGYTQWVITSSVTTVGTDPIIFSQFSLDPNTVATKLITPNRQTASYSLVLTDADKLVEMNVGSTNNLTIPLNTTQAFTTGTQILISQYGAGQTTIVATGGVTIRSSGGKLKLSNQYSSASLLKIGTDEWYLFGDITT